MDLVYTSSSNYHKHKNHGQTLNSSATQLDALLEELLNERQHTKEKDICPSSERYRVVEASGEETSIKNNRLQQQYVTHEKVEKSVKDIFLTSVKEERKEFSSINDSYNKDSCTKSFSNNSSVISSPQRKDYAISNFSESILPEPETKITTTVRTYTYELPATKSAQSSYFSNESNDEIFRTISENNNLRNLESSKNGMINYFQESRIERSEATKPVEFIYNKTTHQKDERASLPYNNSQYLVENADKKQTNWKYTFTSNGKNNVSTLIHPQNLNKADVPPNNISDIDGGSGNYNKMIYHNNNLNDVEEIRYRSKNELNKNNSTEIIPKGPSVNKVGSAVYYPPNKPSNKEFETNYSMQSSGRYGNMSAKYEHEYGYKEKSKSSSGGAMIPVCLPLCCAMPCSIM